MSADTVSKDATLKTTTVARVAATSGPAAATAETWTNKKYRRIPRSTEDTGDAPPVVIPVLPTLTIITMSVPAEAVRVDNTDANAGITFVPYSPSESDGSPPPFSTPSPTHSHSAGTIPTPPAPSPPIQSNTSSLRAPTETADRRSNHATGKVFRHDALKKYTEATMPAIHDAYLYAPLQHMDLDIVDEWEKYPGGKLFAHPFDDEFCKRDLHRVKNKIFTAVIEITDSERVGVSPPRPSEAAIKDGCTPTCFLIYNLTEDERQLLLERSVWSSRHITFHVTSFYPNCPSFLFSIKGFATTHTGDVHQLVHSIWHDDATGSFLDSIVEDFPLGERAKAKLAIASFVDSMWVTLLRVKKSGNILAPRFNVYANSSQIFRGSVWKRLRNYLADRVYASVMLGNGIAEVAPYRCGICRSVDHPRGLCPFPDIEGWNGPRDAPYYREAKGQRRPTARHSVRRP